jgi:hypothetical protein
MMPLTDQLHATLRDHALSTQDHHDLDSRGQGVYDLSGSQGVVWGWQVTVSSNSVHITAQAKPVASTRAEAFNHAEDLFDRLTALLPDYGHSAVGAWTVYDRVNNTVVGWVGNISIRARRAEP